MDVTHTGILSAFEFGAARFFPLRFLTNRVEGGNFKTVHTANGNGVGPGNVSATLAARLLGYGCILFSCIVCITVQV